MELKRKDCYNLTELKTRGWTASIIKKLVTITPIEFKGLYRKQPQKCYPKEYIESLEQSDQFTELKNKATNRQKTMKAIADKKRAENIAKFTKQVDQVKVPVLTSDELKKRTIESKQDWYDYQSCIRDNFNDRIDADHLPNSVLFRWEVNFIRHELTKYENVLARIYRQVGTREIYPIIKNHILDKIANAYPWLSDECQKQKTA